MEDSLFSDEELEMEVEKAPVKKEVTDKKEKEKEVFDKKIYIVDGYSLIYRSYFAFLSHPLTDPEGKNVSAYFGFFNTLFMLLKEYKFDYFVVALDSHVPTFRHEMYKEYKANREAAPEDLHAQVPRIEETLKRMNIPYIEKPGYEADDLIATITKNATEHGIDSVMVTGDKDLLQLVNDHVFALRPPKKGQPNYELFGAKEVEEAYLVKPSQMVDYLSLIGDTADNVPGVKGIGEKTAAKLLAEYVSLDGVYRHLDSFSKGVKAKLEAGKESAYLSKELIVLKDDVFTIDSFDETTFRTDTIDYLAGISDFTAAACYSLSRAASAFVDRKADVQETKKQVFAENEKKEEVPAGYLGLGEYKAVTDITALRGYFEDARRSGGVIAFDAETTGLDALNADIVGFSFSYELKKAYYVPIIASGETVVPLEPVVQVLKDYFSTGRLRIVGQNVKYDLTVLEKLGVTKPALEADTMIEAWLLDSNAGVYNLEALASSYLSYDAIPYVDAVEKGKDYSSVSVEIAVRYSAEDSDLTWRLYKLFGGLLEEKGLSQLLTEYEMPLIPVLAGMEREGIKLDKPFMAELDKTLSARYEELEKEIYKEAGHEFNINSSLQLSKVLFEEMGLPAVRRTQRGWSTDTATLESLRGKGARIVDLVLDYRAVAKLFSTYVDTLPSLCDDEGRIHTSYLQTGTATGRLSSRNPNLQNIPIRTEEGRLIRNAFIPRDGWRFLSADYSQIELVVLSHMAEDEELQKAFKEGEDVHAYTASLIFEKPVAEVSSSERRVAKTINFGIMYGMSSFRLSNELSISRTQAKDFIDRYFDRYKGVRKFVDDTVKSAEENGYVKTAGGHVRVVQGINSRNKNEKQAASRVAVNTVIQGTAAEIMKKAMISIAAELEKRNLKSRMLLQIHDELIFEVPPEEEEELYALVREKMESAVKLSVPLKAGIEFGSRWGDMH